MPTFRPTLRSVPRTTRTWLTHPVPVAGCAALVIGAVLCVVGWYGVSGERFAERQLPYLASCTIPGAALIVAGAVLLARGRDAAAAARVEELYTLLTAPGPAGAEQRGTAGAPGPADVAGPAGVAGPVSPADVPGPVAVARELRAVPGGALFHRADCPLVADRADAVPVDARRVAHGGLAPCPICRPTTADA